MKKVYGFIIIAILLFFNSAVLSSAQTVVLQNNFESATNDGDFRKIAVQGDLNSDERSDSVDLVLITKHLLGISQTALADVNLDGQINVIDLIRLKKITITYQQPIFYAGQGNRGSRGLVLEEKIGYNPAFVSTLQSNSTYRLTCKAKGTSLTVTVKGVGASDIVSQKELNDQWQTATVVWTTANLIPRTGYELYFSGSARLDDLKIEKISEWVEGGDQGSPDIF